MKIYVKLSGLFLFTVLAVNHVRAQNLLANPSFEDANYCEGKIPCSPAGWFSVSNWPSGYFKNSVKPFKGSQSLGFIIASSKGKVRNYWQTKLLCSAPLMEPLTLRFFLYPVQHTINRAAFGIAFIDKLILSVNDTLLSIANYTDLSDAIIKQNRNGWYEVELSCKAPVNGHYIVMGNFDSTTVPQAGPGKYRFEEYYIDQISLTSKHNATCNVKAMKDSLYSITTRHIKQPKRSGPQTYTASLPEVVRMQTDTFSLGVENFELDKAMIKNPRRIDSVFEKIDLASIQSIFISGFTDRSGPVEYNQKLSQARAEAVRDYIVSKFVKDPSIVFATGKGVSLTFNDEQLNRRVEIIVNYKTK
jgi:outer membrane protein OmpA-like peptidoglycan-associated protein